MKKQYTMPTKKDIFVSSLQLDFQNPRIGSCETAIDCLIAIYNNNQTQFDNLIRSIIEVGFLGGEYILVQKSLDGKYIVKEGNRRISALKVLLGDKELSRRRSCPPKLLNYARRFSIENRRKCRKVSCLVFDESHADQEQLKAEIANRHLTGRTNDAKRLAWPTLHTARKERDDYGKNSPALNLMERYFEQYPEKESEWAATYDLTVLEDFIPHIARFLGYQSKEILVSDYPNPATQEMIDQIISDIQTKSTEGISKLANRRDNAPNFLSQHYHKPTASLNPIEKPQPTRPAVSVSSSSTVRTSISPRVTRPDPLISSLNQLIDHSSSIGLGAIKLCDALKELRCLVKQNKNLIAVAMLLRAVLDYSSQFICIQYGKTLPKKEQRSIKKTLDTIKRSGIFPNSDESIVPILQQIIDARIDSLHTFMHSPILSPTRDDVRTQASVVFPVIDAFLVKIIERKEQKAARAAGNEDNPVNSHERE